MKEESKKVDLKLNIQKMKIMASGPITSWEIDGQTMETVSDFILLGSMSDSSRPHRLQPTRLLCPWDSPGKSTGIGCHCLLQFSSYHDVFHDPDNQDGVITHLEPDILEYEVKWALESITTNKASGGDGIQLSYLKS